MAELLRDFVSRGSRQPLDDPKDRREGLGRLQDERFDSIAARERLGGAPVSVEGARPKKNERSGAALRG
jgi:hypothetical protein